jgi:hypothetical protein
MTFNPIKLTTQTIGLWSKTLNATSQAAISSKVTREILRFVIYVTMMMAVVTLWQTFMFIRAGKVDIVVGTLLGGIFTLFSGILSVAIPALITALKVTEQPSNPVQPPPPTPTSGNV